MKKDAIAVLKADHKEVEALFKRFEKAGDGATQEKQRIAEQVVKLLSIHATIEEELLYPAARQLSPKLEDQVLEALEEHHVAKATLAELEKMSASDERFDAKLTVLSENIRHHVKEEEEDLFPKLRKLMGSAQLEALGAALIQAKKMAPTHPHPMAPDTPPGNIISGVLAKILDSAKDLAKKGTRNAARSLSARMGKRGPKARRTRR